MSVMADQQTSDVLSQTLQSFSRAIEVQDRYGDTGRALVQHAKRQTEEKEKAESDLLRWKRWWASAVIENGGFETNEDLELLRQCRELTLVWKDFRKSSVFRKLKVSIGDDVESMPPSLDTLTVIINQLQMKWEQSKETRWGKAKANLVAFGEKLGQHKTLFSFFPSGNIYTGLLAGVISTVLTCCENHRTVAEGFTRAIQEIGAYFSFIQKTGKVMSMFAERTKTPLDTREVRLAISRAYIPVFKFLCHAMEWHSSSLSRFKTTFNVKFYDENVKELVEEVKRLAEHLDRVVTQAIAEDTNKKVYEIADQTMHRDVRRGGADQNRQLAAPERSRNFSLSANLLSGEVGLNAARTLISSEEQHDHDVIIITQIRRAGFVELPTRDRQLQPTPRLQLLSSDSNAPETSSLYHEDEPSVSGPETTRDPNMPSKSRHYARFEIEQHAQSLTSFTKDGRAEAHRSLNTPAGASIPQELLSMLQRWLRQDKTDFLWVEGAIFPADLSPTALRVSLVTSEAGIPCVSFFDKPRYATTRASSLSQKQAGLVALLYSVISQLVNTLPPVFETELNFDKDRFAKLDGTAESIKSALETIKQLLSYAPPSLVCVIDGIQTLESRRETVSYLEELVDILREQGSKTVVKVLFTTDGMSLSLAEKIKRMERVSASSMAQRRPGGPARGQMSLSYLTAK
ncbi:hypothetical protein QBC44DRAFT_323547 [Cladorrhinum sp. PSN332]|nr:hypothetical protein QBC44DRAFT_323547 [Cladorrhinum sp. PSN332]